MTTPAPPPPGLDLGRLSGWLPAAVPEAGGGAPRLQAALLAGGKSNLTYEVTDAVTGRSWVLRRPPLGHVLATAHDMAREYRVMSALAGTGVPVPATFALCTDTTVIGAPVLPDGARRRHGLPVRGAAGAARAGAHPGHLGAARSTRSPRCTRWTRRRLGWATSAGPRASWPGRSAAGASSSTPRAAGTCPVADELYAALSRQRPAGIKARHRARRLPARQRADRRRRPHQRRSSTGRWRRSATRSPTWRCC